MSSPQNVNIFEDIQARCSDFRRQWRKGEPPRIEDYVSRLDETARQTLFQNLLHVELEFRRRQGESPSSDEYIARFPQFGRLIRQAFFESTIMSMQVDAETPAEQETLVIGLPTARKLGEYELLRELGRGGFGVVYAARHLRRGETVALKTLPTDFGNSSHSLDGAERLHKFRQEFRTLSEVNHPNLVGMQTLEVDGDQWFFTMDLVDGVDFLEYVRPEGRFDEDRLRATLAQLVEAIIALHDRSIVHRDLKPSNVLVTAEGRVVVLDFGLVTELQSQTGHTISLLSQQFVGTPRYAAPEQAAGARSSATDWYALGVMLYEALTNEVPFSGTAVQLLVKKQTTDAPSLSGRPGVPSDLAELVERLLQREPDLRPDAASICQALGIVSDTVSHDSTDSSLSEAPTQGENFLIGRESQLAELERARQALLRGKEPIVVFVRGRSGEGKTSLVEKFLQPLRRERSMLVLSGRCYDRESVPFKAIDCIIDALVAHLRSRSSGDVHALVPNDIPMLVHLFPVLRRVPAIADRAMRDITGIDSRQIRYRAFAALREMLATISRSTPVILFIDDLQWGDADSATALFELLQPPDPPVAMLLGSYRSDEADESPFLQQWNASVASRCQSNSGSRAPAWEPVDLQTPSVASSSQASGWERSELQALPASREAEPQEQRVPRREPGNEGLESHTASIDGIRQLIIEVSSLTEDQCLSLLAARLGLEHDALRDRATRLFQAAHGNPYFLEQLIEGFDAETGQFQAIPLHESINRKLRRLPSDARALLEAVAVAGQAVKLNEVAKVSGHSTQAFATITHMRSERLVRLIGSNEQQLVDTYHDKIRETTLDGLADAERCRLHIRFGELIESTEGVSADEMLQRLACDVTTEELQIPATDRIFDLAYHFHAAADPGGFAYQMMAGELSFQAYASEDALEFLRRAAASCPEEVSRSIRFRLCHRLARSLARVREFDEALEQFQKALTEAGDYLQRADIYEGIATTYRSRSQYRSALDNYDKALVELGLPRPKGAAAIIRCLPQILRLAMRTPNWTKRRDRSVEDATKYALAQEICIGLLAFIWELPDGMISYPYVLLRMQDFSHSIRNPGIWCGSLALSGGHFAINGFPWLGKWLLAKAELIAREINDEETKGVFLLGSAMINHYSSNPLKADQQYADGFQHVVKTRSHTYIGGCAHMHRHLHAVIAPSSVELATAKRTLHWAQTADDKRTQCWGHYDIANALARAGDISTALRHIEAARQYLQPGERNLTDAIFLGTEGYVRLQASAYEAARFSLEAAWYLIKRRKLLMDVTVRALPYLIESLVGPEWTHPTTRQNAKRLKRLCRVAVAMDWLYPNIASPAQRARGRAYCSMGKTRKAIRCFRKAIRSAQEFGADYDHARSMLDLAAVQEEGSDELRREAISLLKQQESVIPYAERWLLGDLSDQHCVAPRLETQTNED